MKIKYDFNLRNRKEADIAADTIKYLLTTIDWDEETIEEQVNSVVGTEVGLNKDDMYQILGRFISNSFSDPMRSFFL